MRLKGPAYVFLLFMLLSCPLYGQRRIKEENALLRRNEALLKAQVDSLRREAEFFRAQADSLRAEAASSVAKEPSCDSLPEVSDSLIHLWYVQTGSFAEVPVIAEGERLSSDVPDDVFAARLQALNSPVPLSFNDIVRNYCIQFSERMPSLMGKIMGLTEHYWPIFDGIFTAYSVPLDLKVLVIVESKLKSDATSRVGAKGLWQFMYGTARGYGLKVDSWVDERMDPVKSTEAAARYLRDAHRLFGDWLLALASYNCGANGVNKAIRRSGGKRDFWDIYPYLPRETRSYVPAFIGALYATKYYKEHGIVPRKAAVAVPVDTFIVRRNLHFEQVSSVLGVPLSTVKDLNPQYFNSVLPGDDGPCVLRLPVSATTAFIEAGDSLYNYRHDEFFNPVEIKKLLEASSYGPPGSRRVVYVVKSGDSLGLIAKRNHVTVAQIRQWNNLKSTTIRIGQKLVLYKR